MIESGATDTYDVVLSELPAGDVQVTVVADSQTEISTDGNNFFSSRILTFTSLDGTTPQTITIRAVDDLLGEGLHFSTITHSITSTADPVDFPMSLMISDVVATVLDDENINFAVDYLDGAGEGFFDPTLGAIRQNALEFALDIWEGLLEASYAGETIAIDAEMNSLGGGILGGASPNSFRNVGGFMAGEALSNHLFGFDLDPADSEIGITLNSDFGSWYYGTDENPSGSQWDFVSVVIHEIGHGLNFFNLINNVDGSYFFGIPGIYDSFLELGDGTDLTSMNNAARAAALISDDLFWKGPNGTSENGGLRVEIYAPTTYEPGSSVSHVNKPIYQNVAVMTPSLFNGSALHQANDFELGMMQDMGWTITIGGGAAAMAGGGDGGFFLADVSGNVGKLTGGDALGTKFSIAAKTMDLQQQFHLPVPEMQNKKSLAMESTELADRPLTQSAFSLSENSAGLNVNLAGENVNDDTIALVFEDIADDLDLALPSIASLVARDLLGSKDWNVLDKVFASYAV